MILELIEDIVKLTIIIACLYISITIYVRNKYPSWGMPVEKRRFSILLGLTLAVVAIKISEDVVNKESGVFDKSILLYIHTHFPISLNRIFEIITGSGSVYVLLILTVIVTLLLVYTKKHLEAFLIAGSVINALVIVYFIKLFVGRDRPSFWPTEWYWGSSFPSGHTLVVSTFSMAIAFCIGRIWPSKQKFALSIAILWISLVALSRLVLGVHWPTDVLAAICIGVFIPLATNILIQIKGSNK